MEVIYFFGMGQAFFFSLLLLRKKGKNISDKVLALWLFVIGLHLFSAFMDLKEIHYQYPILIVVFAPFPLLHGPLLWIYVKSLIRKRRKARPADAAHVIPYLTGLLIFAPVQGMSPDELRVFLEETRRSAPLSFQFLGYAIQFSGMVYAVWVYFLLKRYRQFIAQEFSFEEGISLAWLRYLVFGLAGIWLVVFLSMAIMENRLDVSLPFRIDFFIYTSVTLFVFLLGYYGIRQGNIFLDKEVLENQAEEGPRYQRSGLKPQQAEQYYQALQDYLEREEPYLDSELSLNQLARAMGLSPNHLSQVINEKTRKNFYQFINTYRIEAFKKKVADPGNRHLTLLAIALDCGFNSKSSFNQVFKKMTGETPSEYLAAIAEKNG